MFKTHRQTEEDDGHFRRFPRYLVLSVCLILLVAGATPAQHARHDLGTINFPVTCSSQAQTEFNRAVALLHHMTYPQAREAFQRVAAVDPHCAMAHWGIAMTLFQPLWPTRLKESHRDSPVRHSAMWINGGDALERLTRLRICHVMEKSNRSIEFRLCL